MDTLTVTSPAPSQSAYRTRIRQEQLRYLEKYEAQGFQFTFGEAAPFITIALSAQGRPCGQVKGILLGFVVEEALYAVEKYLERSRHARPARALSG